MVMWKEERGWSGGGSCSVLLDRNKLVLCVKMSVVLWFVSVFVKKVVVSVESSSCIWCE